jgi:nitroreductase
MNVLEALQGRRSVRGFSPTEVPAETLTRVFAGAQAAPSWCNIQPWRVWLLSGDAKKRVTGRLVEAAKTGVAPGPDVPFPVDYPEPYATHRRTCGRALYEAMGVERHDHEGRQAAWLRNFAAFDAPHVAFVAADKRIGPYVAVDLGCWLQSVLLLAQTEGLATCAQAALSLYPGILREELGIGDDLAIWFGIAIGYEDAGVKANACRTTRDDVSKNVVFVRA